MLNVCKVAYREFTVSYTTRIVGTYYTFQGGLRNLEYVFTQSVIMCCCVRPFSQYSLSCKYCRMPLSVLHNGNGVSRRLYNIENHYHRPKNYECGSELLIPHPPN